MSEEIKLQALGRIKEGIPLKTIMADLEVSYPKLLKWRKELQQAEEAGTVLSLLQADRIVVEQIADQVKHDLEDLGADPEAIEGELADVVKGIDNYQLLNANTQKAALALVTKINTLAILAADASDVAKLVTSLSELQNAFFNRNVTNVAVLPGSTGTPSSTALSLFKNSLRS